MKLWSKDDFNKRNGEALNPEETHQSVIKKSEIEVLQLKMDYHYQLEFKDYIESVGINRESY